MATAVSSFLNRVRGVFHDLFRLLYPACCCCCGDLLAGDEKYICTRCLLDLPSTHDFNVKDNVVELKLAGRVPLEAGGALFVFRKNNKVQRVVHRIKYYGNTDLAVRLGVMLGNELVESGRFSDVDCIIPVPLHRRRLWQRGYNQSELICQGISRALDRPVVADQIYRTRYTHTQTHKNREDRQKNVQGVFAVRNPDTLEGKHVLLVDDVITTGATTDSCYQVMMPIPGLRISVAALAVAD